MQAPGIEPAVSRVFARVGYSAVVMARKLAVEAVRRGKVHSSREFMPGGFDRRSNVQQLLANSTIQRRARNVPR